MFGPKLAEQSRMNHQELIQIVAHRVDMPQSEVKRILHLFTAELKQAMDKNERVTIPGLGTFIPHMRKERRAYSVYHGQKILLPKKRVVQFHPSSHIKASLKNKRV